MRLVICYGFAILVASSFLGYRVASNQPTNFTEQGDHDLSTAVRKHLNDHLRPLEAPSLYSLLGRNPNLSELTLGRHLFNDPILSRNNDTSCATCHLSNHGFADGNPLPIGALGIGGPNGFTVRTTAYEGDLSLERSLGHDGFGFFAQTFMFRNSLSTINVAYRVDPTRNEGLFHDGRFGDLEFQVLLPIHTGEELCGTNPIPLVSQQDNPYRKGGPLFNQPVTVTHSHGYDPVTGSNTGFFNGPVQVIEEVPLFRPTGSITIPTRNECLAIAIAKIRSVPAYLQLFKQAFGTPEVTDQRIAQALAAFILTHVSIRTPYDAFARGKNTLSNEQLLGMVSFYTPLGNTVSIGEHTISGAGCITCHSGPTFGGKGFANLGVRSDPRSSLSRPADLFPAQSAFFVRPTDQRGRVAKCHIEGISVDVTGNYGPDIGRANGSRDNDDCFKFRIPPLRNVLDTYPYFHHGTARLQGRWQGQFSNVEALAFATLKEVVRYHLRGPVSIEQINRSHITRRFFDRFFQTDFFIPYFRQDFVGNSSYPRTAFPIELSEDLIEGITQFIAYGLRDPLATVRGSMGNNVTHPRVVPSGFLPTITRDHGTQLELPPHRKLE